VTQPHPIWSHTSWSQIEKFRLCPRRWKYSKTRPDIVEEPTEPLLLGNECHEIAEARYEGRAVGKLRYDKHVAYDSTRRLLADPRLPPVTGDIKVEYPRDRQLGIEIAGVPVQGRCDLLWGRSAEHLVIVDWKTLNDWRSAKDEEKLERFGQMIIYGAWAFLRLPTVKTVSFMHGQIHTKKEDYDVVTTRDLDRDHVFGVLPSIERTVAEMREVYAIPNEADVPMDTSQCRAFGRPCPYSEICPRSIYSGIDSTPAVPKEGETVSLADRLKARAAAQANKNPDTAAANQAALESAAAAAATATTAVTSPPVRATGINPPDAAKPDFSMAGSYGSAGLNNAARTTATDAPKPGAIDAALINAAKAGAGVVLSLTVELGGRRFSVNLPAVEVLQ
jgi:CRISPR/Cas system-associated exonuclease Cas4 (RecB family)